MSNIYFNVTTEKKWPTQNFDFLSLKSSSLGQHLRSSNSCRCQWIFNFLLQLKNHTSGSKLCVAFLLLWLLKWLWHFKVKHSMLFVEQTLIKTRQNWKPKIPYIFLERWTLWFSSCKNCGLKVKLLDLVKEKKNICVSSQCFISINVLNKISEYIYF